MATDLAVVMKLRENCVRLLRIVFIFEWRYQMKQKNDGQLVASVLECFVVPVLGESLAGHRGRRKLGPLC